MLGDLCCSSFRGLEGPLLIGLIALALAACGPTQAQQPAKSITTTPSAIALQGQTCRWEIGLNGQNLAFTNLADKTNYCEPGQPFMQAQMQGKLWPSTAVALAGDLATITFGASGLQVQARLEVLPERFAVTVVQVNGGDPDWLQIANLRLKITDHVGPMVNVGWDDHFGAAVLACNDLVDSAGADGGHAHLVARCYREYGFKGARVAILGVPTGGPDPAKKLLEAIGRVEVAEGLPHPMLHGVWIKQAPERFASYLMVYGCGEDEVDDVIAFARGGFGCIELDPWQSTPTYGVNTKSFPHGLAGLKQAADKIHGAGMMVGLHAMQGMVGWGPKDDPYIVPKADPRLLQDKHATLVAALDDKATQITVRESVAGWPDKGDLFVDGEIVRYARKVDNGFADCQRGLWGTTVAAHPAGLAIGNLVNCFAIWGNTVYCPDIKSTMIDEICDNLARTFNAIGADMSYFDGGEEVAKQPPYWHNQGKIALGVSKRLKQPVLLGGNALYTHLAWHVITRGSPHFDPVYFGRREYTLRFKGVNPAGWANNLLTGDVGWFMAHPASPTTDAVTPDEMSLLCLKAVGGRAPISLLVGAKWLWANKRMPEMLEIIRACDELKRRDVFTEATLAALAKPRAEHALEQLSDGQWDLRPLQFGPTEAVNTADPQGAEWQYSNPYGPQSPWLRLRARTQTAPYGAKQNIVLADPASGIPFQLKDSSAADLVQTLEPSKETAPDGTAAFCYRAENRSQSISKWCQISVPFAKPLNLVDHRRLGVWVRGDNSGGILNFQLAATDARRDHYVTLDFAGWKLCELAVPEDKRFWEYTWAYPWTDLMYTCQPVYNATRELNVFYNALPAGARAACLIGRIEALQESALPLRNPALQAGGQTIAFAVSLMPDEYLETGVDGRCRHFDANGGLLGEVKPQGALQLSTGDNLVRLTSDGGTDLSTRAEVTLSVKGEPLTGARRPNLKATPKAAINWYPSLMPTPPAATEELKVLPGNAGSLRVMRGVYELAGGTTHILASFDGKDNTWDVTSPVATPVAVTITRGSGGVNYPDPRAVTLESFDDVSNYEMSSTNRYEKYVVGDGKQVPKDGPAREGVTHSLTLSTTGARVGASCAVYTATNSGGPSGWCAKGRRLTKPTDFSGYRGLGMWVDGDAHGELLKVHLRDIAGGYLDWLIPIDYTGWRMQQLPLSPSAGFDLKHVEYLIFYYNDLPANSTCTVRMDDLKLLPAGGKQAPLGHLSLAMGGRAKALPVTLAAGETLAIGSDGVCSVWRNGLRRGGEVRLPGGGLTLSPGATKLSLDCAGPPTTLEDMTVGVYRVGSNSR